MRLALLLVALTLVPVAAAASLADVTVRYQAGASGYADFALVQAGEALPCDGATLVCLTLPQTGHISLFVRDDTGFPGSVLVRFGEATTFNVICGSGGVRGPATTQVRIYAGPATCTNVVPNPIVTTTGTVRVIAWD